MEIRSSKYSFAALRQELNILRKAIRAEVTKRSKAGFGSTCSWKGFAGSSMRRGWAGPVWRPGFTFDRC